MIDQVTLQRMSLYELFDIKELEIPNYQRTYSWRSSHVLDLLKDTFGRTTPYLMGTVILHDHYKDDNKQTLDIVDGQQRLVTLTILLHELQKDLNEANNPVLPLLGSNFTADAAKVIRNTRKLIKEFLFGITEKEKKQEYFKFLYDDKVKSFQFHVLIMNGDNALDRAYTFFDSVNSKGKTLTDFELLKAHHLMFIPPRQEALARCHNDDWQRKDTDHSQLFSTSLRRIRMWARGENRDTKQERPDYNEFSSIVEPENETDGEHMLNRYMQPCAFRSWRRIGEKIVLSMDYPVVDGEAMIPMEITQTIEGGDAFFLYSKRYHGIYDALFIDSENERPSTAISFVRHLARFHISNTYLKDAFCAVILLYFDKFGEDRLIEVGVCVERIVSALRWEKISLRIEGTLTHIRDKRLVSILLDSVNTLHVCTQLNAIARKLPALPDKLSATQQLYYDAIKRFYEQEKDKIGDRTRPIANFYLNTVTGALNGRSI